MELLKQPENQEISYLTAMIQDNVDKWDQKSKSNLDERVFFGKVMGLAKKVTLKAVENRDTQIFKIFQKYLGDISDNDLKNNSSEEDFDSENEKDENNENDSLLLQNPI